MNETGSPLAKRSTLRLEADPTRVVTRFFVPGQDVFDAEDWRASPVIERILQLSEGDAQDAYDDVLARFGERHRHLEETFQRHAAHLVDRLAPGQELSPTRLLLLGSTFTNEFAIEGAAVCNPSMVAAPDQVGVPTGSLRFVMSVRGIGEGHRSSIGFRTGLVDADGNVDVDSSTAWATVGSTAPAPFDLAVFRGEVDRLGGGGESADFILDELDDRFTVGDLERQLERLQRQATTRRQSGPTITLLRQIAARTYQIRFARTTPIAERVLWPVTAAEQVGMEDARFVRFVDDGEVRYYATYTAFDGADIGQQLLETRDFSTFISSPVVGPAAGNKGLALFPRMVGGRYAALSRFDRESNSIAFSDNPRSWPPAHPCQAPSRWWEAVQLGNCGSPIETEAGWLVLTHGVGPMRTYSIGALLLDLDDPTRIVGRLRDPLLAPSPGEQDGYVPNVAYSCGALVHGGVLVLPYGIGDSAIGMASVRVADLITALGG